MHSLKKTGNKAVCPVCWRHCALTEGEAGFCGARKAIGGKVVPYNYGRLTSLALDPVEKKPFAFFHPGTFILSAGSFGCNMACSFCQNYEISRVFRSAGDAAEISPEALVSRALACRTYGNIGIAFTYNEPLVGYEFVRDTARLARENGLETAVVTNGQIEEAPLAELLPVVAAWNIDLKVFSEEGYGRLGGRFDVVCRTIERTAAVSHVEVTTLVVPGLSDDEGDMRREAAWLASIDRSLPLHLSRYFPRWHSREPETPVSTLRRLRETAKAHLDHVLLGNV